MKKKKKKRRGTTPVSSDLEKSLRFYMEKRKPIGNGRERL